MTEFEFSVTFVPAQEPDFYPLTTSFPAPRTHHLWLNIGEFKLRGELRHHRVNTHSILHLKVTLQRKQMIFSLGRIGVSKYMTVHRLSFW